MIVLFCPQFVRDLIGDWLGWAADVVGEIVDGPYRGDRHATITPDELGELEAA